mgnify:CR=1 FL=1
MKVTQMKATLTLTFTDDTHQTLSLGKISDGALRNVVRRYKAMEDVVNVKVNKTVTTIDLTKFE